MRRSVWALLLIVAGCSGSSSRSSTESEAPLSEAAKITFNADFTQTVSGSLRAGSTVHIKYASERLPQCRMGLPGGVAGWTITGFATLNGAPAQTFYVAGHSADPTVNEASPPEATVTLPSGGDLAVYFQVTSASGCSAYDSHFGDNFHFAVDGPKNDGPSATIAFDADPAKPPVVTGSLVRGGKVEVHYDPARLPGCRMGLPNGVPGWSLSAHAKTAANAAPVLQRVAGLDPTPHGDPRPPTFDLDGPGPLELWFDVHDAQGCIAYDSNLNRNYAFPIEP